MNCYTLTIVRHPIRSRGWLVILEWIMDVPAGGTDRYGDVFKGQQFARLYKYRKDADECESVARHSLDEAPTFLPIEQVWPEHASFKIIGDRAFKR